MATRKTLRAVLSLGILGLALSFVGCGDEGGSGPEQAANGGGRTQGPETTVEHPGLRDPSKAVFETPETYKARFRTTRGDFVIEVTRSLAPLGADRFYALVKTGYYDGCMLHRVLPGFVVQWGFNADGNVTTKWSQRTIQDDPVKSSNLRGTVSFAMGGPNTRSTQVFVNLADSRQLDGMGFSPFGRVVSGMDVLESLVSRYGEKPNNDARWVMTQGNAYLKSKYPDLDSIIDARIVGDG